MLPEDRKNGLFILFLAADGCDEFDIINPTDFKYKTIDFFKNG